MRLLKPAGPMGIDACVVGDSKREFAVPYEETGCPNETSRKGLSCRGKARAQREKRARTGRCHSEAPKKPRLHTQRYSSIEPGLVRAFVEPGLCLRSMPSTLWRGHQGVSCSACDRTRRTPALPTRCCGPGRTGPSRGQSSWQRNRLCCPLIPSPRSSAKPPPRDRPS